MLPADFRLLQVIAGAEQGGAERFFTRLTVAFHKRGIHQHVVIRPFHEPLKLLLQHDIPVSPAPFRRVLDFSTPRIIKKAMKEFKPHVVLTWMSRASALTPSSDAIFVARLGGYYDLKYYQKANYLVGNTQDIVDYFHNNGWSPAQTRYLPNFPDLPEAKPPLSRSEMQTPEGAPLLLALGRFHDDKAFDILIPALTRLQDAYLWLGGDGEEASKLKGLAQQYGVIDRVRFLGWRSDVSALYQACDIYVCPSRIEPLGNVILEAWAHQKPVVAARSSGPAALIQHGQNGMLADIDSVNGLAQALKVLIDDHKLRKEIAQRGYKTYQAYFTEEAVVDAYWAFFQEII
jgi:glycosyltransferase involved in cell wall biosynthesis